MTTIRPATTPDDIAAVRQLCWEYRAHLAASSPIDAELTETFYAVPKYTALMDSLETLHARPTGIILLAEHAGAAVACAMSHALFPDTAEFKRLYVTPQFRRLGLARALVVAMTEQARQDGFSRAVLDTSKSLKPARALYAALGFAKRDAYQYIPASALPHLVFFEKTL